MGEPGRLLKHLLRRALGRSGLNYEEMLTGLCDSEGIIKSRPITYLSDAVTEFVPLTPAMFIQDIKEIRVPDCHSIEHHQLAKRFRYRQKLKDALRQRFRSECLGELQHHVSRSRELRELKVEDVVLVGDDHSKRLNWPLARVKGLITGKGGKCRVARVITSTGELTRPIQRLYLLEMW